MRRGLASFARDVRDDADPARELLEVDGVALNISTDEVVEGAVVRALRVLAVDQTHGCGYEVEVAAGSESAGRACRPARQEHTALLLPAGTRTGIQRVCVCDVVSESSALPASNVCSRLSAQTFDSTDAVGTIVHSEAALDAESHACAAENCVCKRLMCALNRGFYTRFSEASLGSTLCDRSVRPARPKEPSTTRTQRLVFSSPAALSTRATL